MARSVLKRPEDKLAKGSPAKTPPADAAKRIEELAARGLSIPSVARSLRTSVETFKRWLNEHPELREAFDAGRAEEELVLRGVLFDIATDKTKAPRDRILASLSILNARHGWRTNEQPDQSRVNVVVNLPAARPLADVEIDDGNGRTAIISVPETRS